MARAVETFLSFFDLQVAIQSDDPRYLDLYTRLYPRFITTNPVESSRTIHIKVFANPNNIFGVTGLVLDDELFPLEKPVIATHLYALVLREFQRRLDSHFLFHAGVVCRSGKGILLVGDAYHGKTTLVLELVRRGYSFLSDEIAAISRYDKKVYPYPRYVNVRPPTVQHLNLDFINLGEINENMGNYPTDIEKLYPGSMGSAAPIGAICILCDPTAFPDTPGTSSSRMVHIWVDRPTAGFLSDLETLNGAANLVVRDKSDHSLITLTTNDSAETLARIRFLCDQQCITLLGITSGMGHKPEFNLPPQLKPISLSQAALYLLQRSMGGREALLKSTPGGRPAHLFAELAGLISDAECYSLSVGPLAQMADLIDGLAR